jgi:hypothetical protein
MPARGSSLRERIPRQTRLGEMLRLYRTIRHQSLREVAPEIGISVPTLLRIETGQPGLDAATLLKLWTWLLGTHEVSS